MSTTETPSDGEPHHDDPIRVTVRPLPPRGQGGANVDLAPHLERVGKQVSEAFARMIAVVGDARADEFTVRVGLRLEGTTNWVLAGASAEASLEVEGTWKRKPGA